MTEVEFVGLRSKKQANLYESAIKYYADQLFNRDPGLQIAVEFHDALEADAFCICLIDGRNPKLFVIEINKKLKQDEVLKALAHEMVHVKQYRTNQIKYVKDDILWEGQRYLSRENMESIDTYILSPWEKEAYTREEELYNNFIMQYNS
mgnify:CR=1 FL=1